MNAVSGEEHTTDWSRLWGQKKYCQTEERRWPSGGRQVCPELDQHIWAFIGKKALSGVPSAEHLDTDQGHVSVVHHVSWQCCARHSRPWLSYKPKTMKKWPKLVGYFQNLAYSFWFLQHHDPTLALRTPPGKSEGWWVVPLTRALFQKSGLVQTLSLLTLTWGKLWVFHSRKPSPRWRVPARVVVRQSGVTPQCWLQTIVKLRENSSW